MCCVIMNHDVYHGAFLHSAVFVDMVIMPRGVLMLEFLLLGVW